MSDGAHAPDDASGPEQLGTPAFVGRLPEMRMLADALDRAPAVVLVEGEAGVGKSRLLQEFFVGDHAHGAVAGTCLPYRQPATLAVVIDALLQAGDRVPGLRLSPVAGTLRPLFPEWTAVLPPAVDPPGDAEGAREWLFRALAEVLEKLGLTVLVLEDLHWADEVSLEFLRHLLDRPAGPRVSMVFTYRPEELSTGSRLLSITSRLPAEVHVRRLSLSPLEVANTAALASSMLDGAPVSGSFADYLQEHTEGLPLAVEESVRLLGERADLVLRDGLWTRRDAAAVQVPPSIRDATLERVRRLHRSALDVLEAAAVLAEPADESTLARVAGLAHGATQAATATGLGCGLLRRWPGGRYAFRHVLPSRAVYDTIPGPRLRRLHRRAGRTLARSDRPPVVRLARHFRLAGDVGSWADYAEQAAHVAAASGDYLAAFDLLEPLLAVPAVPLAERARLANKVASAALLRQVFVDGRARALVATLRTLRDSLSGVARAELGNLLGRLLNQLGDHADGFNELVHAVPQLSHDPLEAARSLVHLGWPRAGPWPAVVHLRYLRRIERLPLAEVAAADRLSLLVDRAVALLQLGAVQGWEVVAALPTEVADPDERLHLARGYLNLGDAALLWGRYAEARRMLDLGLALADAGDLSRVRYGAQVTLAHLDWLSGGWDGLLERLTSLAGAEDANPSIRDEAALVAGLREAAGGARARAGPALERLLHEAHVRGAASMALAPTAALARLRLDECRPDLADELTADAVRLIEQKRIWVWASDLAPVRVEALLARGAVGPAGELVSAFAAGLRGRPAPGPRAALAMCRALFAEATRGPAAAAAAFGRAVRCWQALPRPYEALRARERQAVALLAAGREQRGTGLLTQALRGLSALGADADADRVAQRLRRLGKASGRLWWGGADGYGTRLSPREREVAELVAAGMTNREIADRLGKAPGTVAQQIGSAMRRLGVNSRTALAVHARDYASGSPPDSA